MPAFALHIDSCKKIFDKFRLRKKTTAFSLFAVGSLIVDLEEVGTLKNVHGRSEEFLKYLLKTDPKYAPLALGMIMHEELDESIDASYVNPNIPKAQKLIEQYQLSSEKVKLAAHYLIDHSVNCDIIQNKPEIINVVENVKKKMSHKHAHKIAYHLSQFFKADEKTVLDALHQFRDFDLKQYLQHDTASTVYQQFYFLQQEQAGIKTSILTKIKLAIKYGMFLLKHNKTEIKTLCQSAQHNFKNHVHSYKKSQKKVVKRFTALTSNYALLLK